MFGRWKCVWPVSNWLTFLKTITFQASAGLTSFWMTFSFTIVLFTSLSANTQCANISGLALVFLWIWMWWHRGSRISSVIVLPQHITQRSHRNIKRAHITLVLLQLHCLFESEMLRLNDRILALSIFFSKVKLNFLILNNDCFLSYKRFCFSPENQNSCFLPISLSAFHRRYHSLISTGRSKQCSRKNTWSIKVPFAGLEHGTPSQPSAEPCSPHRRKMWFVLCQNKPWDQRRNQ